MNISRKWLREFVDITATDKEYDSVMTLAGQKVETTERMDAEIKNVVVGKVLSMKKHENSDHMWVCMVDCGIGEPVQIVTGAQNVHEGDLVPVAQHNSYLPGGIHITKGKLRGVESCGMLCSYKELGLTEHDCPEAYADGIWILNNEGCKVGEDMNVVIGNDDSIVEFEITNNRPDCYSLIGLARETAAAFNVPMKHHEPVVKGGAEGDLTALLDVDVQAEDLCLRYTARMVRNVKIAPSPKWMRQRLRSAGIRPINNIVDITNYVMLETGHPMHAFDLAKVKDNHIIVRRANSGETITTLDGKERALTPDMLMIADQTNATGIAGVMGGEESEITEGTTTVLFEIAAFDRTNIRLTTRALGLRTEASGRFERGVCAATCREAADRACQLVNLLNAGEVIDDVYDCYPAPKAEQTVIASVSRINARIGMEIPGEEMARILNQLSFKATLDGDTLRAVVPDFREDIEGEADLSEEVLRIYGYEHIKSTMLRGETSTGTRNVHMQLADRVGRILSAKGLYEIRNFSFVSPKLIEKLGLGADDPRCNQLKLMNPLGEDTSVMRSTLVPSMLGTVSLNQSRNNETAMLYEIAPVFDVSARKPGDLPHEQPSLCIGAYGDGVDFYLIRDIVIDMLSQFGVQAKIVPGAEPYHHPGRAAKLMAGDRCIATVAELHPNVMQAFEITRRTIIAEVNLEMLCELHTKVGHVRALPKFPAVTRDIALVMEEGTTVGSVLDVIRKTGGALLEKAEMFDIYRGAQLLSGKKSVAFSLTFRNAERTLSDDDVNPLMQKILAACEAECSATLRL